MSWKLAWGMAIGLTVGIAIARVAEDPENGTASWEMTPMYHVPPILKYLRGSQGIGDACVRSECLQCCWRLPALLFAVFVAPSVPLVMSILLDMVGRAVRIWAMKVAQRRHAQDRILPVRVPGRFSELVSG